MGWDPERGKDLVGKHIVCGFNIGDADGNVRERLQRHGTIVIADEGGIVVREPSGTEFHIPPDVDALQPARARTYRLKSTGEVVTDPDFQVVWYIGSRGEPGETWEPVILLDDDAHDA